MVNHTQKIDACVLSYPIEPVHAVRIVLLVISRLVHCIAEGEGGLRGVLCVVVLGDIDVSKESTVHFCGQS